MTSSRNSFTSILCAVFLVAVLCGCAGGHALVEAPAFSDGLLVAVLPLENLSGTQAPVRQLRAALLERLKEAGLPLLEEERLQQFLDRRRVRYVGGVDTALAKAFREELGVTAVVVTDLVGYREVFPPQVSLFCRLVSTTERPEILWMDGVGVVGDDHPGLLDLGVVNDAGVLTGRALDRLVDSLVLRLVGKEVRNEAASSPLWRPKITFDSSALYKGKRYSVGVVPLANESERANAGEVMALHLVRQLVARDEFLVTEPGVVRERLLGLRIIMAQGISLQDLFTLSFHSGAELFVSGKVVRYDDPATPLPVPRVDFSVLMLEGVTRRTIWASQSYDQGNEGVRFFDFGRVSTAFELSSLMVRSLLGEVKFSPAPTAPQDAGHKDFFQRFWERQGAHP